MTLPEVASQKRAASRLTVDLPEPDEPTSAVTSPSFAVKLTSARTFSPARPSSPAPYPNATWSNTTSWPEGSNFSLPCTTGSSMMERMRLADDSAANSSETSMRAWSNGA